MKFCIRWLLYVFGRFLYENSLLLLLLLLLSLVLQYRLHIAMGVNQEDGSVHVSLLFTIDNQPGSLEDALKVFKSQNVSLSHIESRPSKDLAWNYDFLTEFYLDKPAKLEAIRDGLLSIASNVTIISNHPKVQTSIIGKLPILNLVYIL